MVHWFWLAIPGSWQYLEGNKQAGNVSFAYLSLQHSFIHGVFSRAYVSFAFKSRVNGVGLLFRIGLCQRMSSGTFFLFFFLYCPMYMHSDIVASIIAAYFRGLFFILGK